MKISLKGNEKNQCIECVSAASIYGISTYMYHQHQPNVGRYTTHGFYGVHIHIPKYMCVPLLCGPLQVHPLGTTHPCVSSDSLFRCHVYKGRSSVSDSCYPNIINVHLYVIICVNSEYFYIHLYTYLMHKSRNYKEQLTIRATYHISKTRVFTHGAT